MRTALTTSLALTAAAVVVAAPALAADMAVKAPPTPTAQVYDWSGFYIGGNIGYSVARNRGTDTLLFPNGTVFASEVITQAPAGLIGGGQVGANWQTGQWVVGLEGDWQWSSERDSICV